MEFKAINKDNSVTVSIPLKEKQLFLKLLETVLENEIDLNLPVYAMIQPEELEEVIGSVKKQATSNNTLTFRKIDFVLVNQLLRKIDCGYIYVVPYGYEEKFTSELFTCSETIFNKIFPDS